MIRQNENTFGRGRESYAKKLQLFLDEGVFDKDVLVLLGVIATRSIKKHTHLQDEIYCAIGSLMCDSVYGTSLLGACRFQVENSINLIGG